MEIKNKKAYFDYFIEDSIECGIELKGTEIKSLRKGSGDLKDTFALVKNGEVFLLNMYIPKYEEGNRFNHEERRTRKLLLHKKEIKKLKEALERDGYSLVPLKAYLVNNRVKILLPYFNKSLVFLNENLNFGRHLTSANNISIISV